MNYINEEICNYITKLTFAEKSKKHFLKRYAGKKEFSKIRTTHRLIAINYYLYVFQLVGQPSPYSHYQRYFKIVQQPL